MPNSAEYCRQYRKANKAKLNAQQRARYARNPTPRIALAKKWAKANRGRIRLTTNARRSRDPEKSRSYHRRKRGAPPPTRPMPSVCDSCHRPEKRKNRALSLDHCHATGAFRGWLCGHCNLALGLLDDQPQKIRALLHYLEKTHV